MLWINHHSSGTVRVDARVSSPPRRNQSDCRAAPAAQTAATNIATIAGSNRPARARCWTRAMRGGLVERSTCSAGTPFGDGKIATRSVRCALAKARYDGLFDDVFETGADFPCGRGAFDKLIWITPAMPLRHGRSGWQRRRFHHLRCAYGLTAGYHRCRESRPWSTGNGLLSRVALQLTLGGTG